MQIGLFFSHIIALLARWGDSLAALGQSRSTVLVVMQEASAWGTEHAGLLWLTAVATAFGLGTFYALTVSGRSHEQLRRILCAIPGRIGVVDLEGNVLFFHDESVENCAMVKLIRDIPNVNCEYLSRVFLQVHDHNKEMVFDYEENGVKRSMTVAPIDAEVFGKEAVIWHSHDNTELQEARTTAQAAMLALRSQIGLQKAFNELLPIMIFAKDPGRDSKYVFGNGEMARFFGVDQESIPQLSYRDLLPEEVIDSVRETESQTLAQCRAQEPAIYPMRDHQGQLHYLNVFKSLFEDETGKKQIIGAAVDVTDSYLSSIKVKRALLDWEEISTFSRVANFRYNKVTQQVTGSSQLREFWTIIDGKPADAVDLVYEEDLPLWLGHFRAVAQGASASRHFTYRILKNNELCYYNIVIKPDPENHDCLIGLVQDVTELNASQEEKRRHEEFIRLTLLSIGDGLISTDEKGCIHFLNPVAESLIGCSSAQAIGKLHTDIFRIVSAIDDSPVPSPVWKTLKTGEKVELANHTDLLAFDGRRYHIADCATPVRDKSGKIIGSILIFRDVTESYESRQKLKASLDSWSRASDIASIINFQMNIETRRVQGDLERVNTYWPLKDGVAIPPEDYIDPDYLENFLRNQDAVFSGCSDSSMISFKVKSQAGERYLRQFWARNHDDPKLVTGLIQDITENKKLELRDQRALKLWKSVIDNLPIMLFIKSQNNGFRYLECNKRFADFIGFTPQEVVGKTDAELFSRELDADNFSDWDREIIKGGVPRELCEQVVGVDGKIHHIATVKLPLLNRNGDNVLVGMSTDVSEDVDKSRKLTEINSQLEAGARFTHSASFRLNPRTYDFSGTAALEELWPMHDNHLLPLAEWVCPEDLPNVAQQWAKLFVGADQVVTLRFRSDWFGKRRHYVSYLVPNSSQDDSPFLTFVLQDISELMEYEEKLQEDARLWKSVIDALPMLFFVKDASHDFRYIMCNKANASYLGLKEEQIIGRSYEELNINKSEMVMALKQEREIAQGNSKSIFYSSDVDVDSVMRKYERVELPFHCNDGRVLLIGVAFDVSERVESLMRAEISEKILSAIVVISDFNRALQYIASIVLDLWNCSKVLFLRLQDEAFLLHYECCLPPMQTIKEEDKPWFLEIWNGFRSIIERDEIICFEDLSKEKEFNNLYQRYPSYPTKSACAVPVIVQGSLWGVMLVSFTELRRFSSSEMSLLKVVADSVSLAITRDKQSKAIQQVEYERTMILENIDIPLWLFDSSGKIIRLNKAAKNLSCEELIKVKLLNQPSNSLDLYRENLQLGDQEYLVHERPVYDAAYQVLFYLKSAVNVTEQNQLLRSQRVMTDCLEIILSGEESGNNADPQTTTKTVSDTISRVVTIICRHYKADSAFYAQIESETTSTTELLEVKPTGMGEYSVLSHKKFSFVATEKWYQMLLNQQPFALEDSLAVDNESLLGSWTFLVDLMQLRSLYCFGLYDNQKLIGYIGIYFTEPTSLVSSVLEPLRNAAHFLELLLERRRSSNELRVALKQAKAADRAKSYFLASMSHEIRTPLNSVIGFTELLRDIDLDVATQNEYLENIAFSGNALLMLVNDILDLSKLEANQMTIVPESTELDSFCRGVCQVFMLSAEQKNIALTFDIESMPILMVDKQRIRQILFNLIGNSVKFTSKGGIKLGVSFKRTSEESGELCIKVSDTGIGISKEDVGRLFDPFVQLSRMRGTNSTNNGTGLGLAIVHKLVNAMGGTITLDSTVGVGSVFTILLPGVKAESQKPKAIESVSASDKADNPAKRKAVVLDGVPLNPIILNTMLRHLGVTCIRCKTSKEALELLESGDISLLITGKNAPDMEIEDFLASVYNIGLSNPVFLMGICEEIDRKLSIFAQYNGVVTKPVDLKKLQGCLLGSKQ